MAAFINPNTVEIKVNLHIFCKIFSIPVLSIIRNMHQNISFFVFQLKTKYIYIWTINFTEAQKVEMQVNLRIFCKIFSIPVLSYISFPASVAPHTEPRLFRLGAKGHFAQPHFKHRALDLCRLKRNFKTLY